MKLPIGSMNVLYTVCKPGIASGIKRPRVSKPRPTVQAFNPPTLCITLRKAA